VTFAAPLFLIAALAGVIPPVLHMIHRQKAVTVHFSTLRFLRLSVERTRRRKYVDDLALMLLRVAALVLVAVGLARPAVTSLQVLWGKGAATAVVVILDNSASMAIMDAGQPRFETARKSAEQVLDVLRDGDSVALLLTDGPVSPEQGRLYHKHETVRQALAQAKLSYERADLAGKLQQARSLLTQADTTHREIYVVTDNQSISWEGLRAQDEEPAEKTPEVPVVLIKVNRDPMPNVALRNIRIQMPAPVAGVPIQASLEVLNTSSIPLQKHLELHIDGTKEAVSPTLNLAPGCALRHEFRFTLDRAGVHRGEVRLAEEDGSPLDNRLYFALTLDQQIAVAIVKSRRHEIPYAEDSFYLERALGPGRSGNSAVRVRSLLAEELAAEMLGDYAIIFCVNLPAPDPSVAERLRDYVRAGGHLFWICGPNVQADAYNRMNESIGKQLLPAELAALRQPAKGGSESWHIGSLEKDHPALAPLAEPASLYQSVLIYKHFPLAPEADGRVLARLDDGQPLLAERAVGAGSVFLLGTGVHVDWTNLPLKPLFLPLFARLVFHAAGAEAARSQVQAGSPLLVPLGNSARGTEIEVVHPSGNTLRLRTPEKDASVFRYGDTHEAGIYLVHQNDPRQPKTFIFAVNPDPEEADPAQISQEELKNRFGRQPLLFCDDPDDLAGTIHRLREGKSLWEFFLAAVLAGLVLEAYLANCLGGKRLPMPVKPAPSGTRSEIAVTENPLAFLEKE